MTLDYLDKGYEKIVTYDYSTKFKVLGNGIMNFSKNTYSKAQEKWRDPEFQENMQHTKQNIVQKTKELGEKTGDFAKKAIESIKNKL